jgi:hypothetical protein
MPHQPRRDMSVRLYSILIYLIGPNLMLVESSCDDRARTLGLLHTLKILMFLAKSKNRYFRLFFRANLAVLGVLVGSAGE